MRAAEQYLAREQGRPDSDCRFDVVAIMKRDGRNGDSDQDADVEILRGAFEAGPER